MPYIGAGVQRFNTADNLTVTGTSELKNNVTVTGDVTASGTVLPTGDTAAGDAAALGFTSAEGLILTGQGSTSDITVKNDADATVFTVPTGTDDILFPDNAKAMFGDSSDLQISHNGSNSVIEDLGEGNLKIKSNGSGINFQKGDAALLATMVTDGAVTLYHNSSAKIATASTGIDITGGFTATDGCTITTADNTAQLTIKSTDADASGGPFIDLIRDSSSPAANDIVGLLRFRNDNSAGDVHTYGLIQSKILDATDGSEDMGLEITMNKDGTNRSRIECLAAETVFNEDSVDIDFRVESNGDTHMLFVDAGNDFVGIGESAPNVLLHVTGPAAQIAIDTTSGGEPLLRFRENGSTRALLKIDGSNNMQFHTGPDGSTAEVARFNASGNFSVGKTDSGDIATVGAELSASGFGMFSRTSSVPIFTNRSDTGDIVQFYRANTLKGSISITSSAVAYNTTSDRRLKQDIEPLEATDKLMAMNPVSFVWKDEPEASRNMGFIAQEMQEIMPQAVSTRDDGIMQMDYGRITPILVSALQDAHKKIEELETRLAALES